MIEKSVAFSKQLVTRTTGVSANYLIWSWAMVTFSSFLIGGLHWLLVKWQIVLLSFFSKHKQEKQSSKNFENVCTLKQNNVGEKSVAHIKLTFCFQHPTQLECFLYLVRSPDYSFFSYFWYSPLYIGHLKFNYCNAFFAFYMS